MMRNIIKAIVISGIAMNASLSQAVVEETGVKMDWSTLRLKAYGDAKPDGTADLKALEVAAWQVGFKKIETFYGKQEAFSGMDKKELRELVRQKTQSTNTAYFADGTVRVYFENAYADIMPHQELGLKSDVSNTSDTRNTGLILKVKGGHAPSPTYRVVAEGSGEVLYSVKDVSKDAFAKNLMGRWVSPTAKKGLTNAVGESPETLEVTSSGADLSVDKAAWSKATEGNRSLLEQARIALVVQPN